MTEESTVTINDRTYSVLTNEEAREKLAAGEVLDGVYVEELLWGPQPGAQGPFDEIELPHRIHLRNCRIGKLHSHGIHFQGQLLFEDVHFEKSVLLGNDREDLVNDTCPAVLPPNVFADDVKFVRCHFDKFADFTGSRFRENALWEDCHFEGSMYLSSARVAGKISFRKSRFEGTFLLRNVEGKGSVDLENARWTARFRLESCHFQNIFGNYASIEGAMRMDQVIVNRDVRFQNLTVEGGVKIFHLQVGEALVFNDSHFMNPFRLQSSEAEKVLSFSRAVFEEEATIRKGSFQSANFNGAVFKGDGYLENFEIAEDLQIQGTQFRKNTSFKRICVRGEALFNDAWFAGEVDYRFAKVYDRLSFSETVFEGETNFYRAGLYGMVFFLGTRFQDVSFVNTAFHDQVFFSFDENTLRERNRQGFMSRREVPLMFVATFEGKANFTNALFYKKAIFENLFFKEFVSFKNTYFNEETSFMNTHFLGGVSFEEIYCSMELNFNNALFGEYVNLDEANINRRLNLTNAVIEKGISFYHAIIDVVVVERNQIEGQLVYEGAVEGKEDWLNHLKVKEEYLILKESYQQRGKFQEEDWAYYRYRVNDRRSTTRKAWQSLKGETISEAEVTKLPDYDPAMIVGQVEKKFYKTQKRLEKLEGKAKKLDEPEEPKSEGHRKYLESEEYKAKIQRQKEEVALEIKEVKIEFERVSKEKRRLQEIADFENGRIESLKSAQEKPYSKGQALWRMVVNTGWVIVDWSTGYGVRPFRIGLVAAVLIALYTGIYLVPFLPAISGAEWPGGSFVVETLNFSAFAFVTEVTDHPILTRGVLAEFLVVSEAFLGLFFMALFVGCYTRKIIR